MSDDDGTDTIDLDHPDRVRIGASRGEFNTEIGRPRDYPTSADLSVRPEGDERVLLTIDAMVSDHGSGHADVELSIDDARELQTILAETVRWMADD